ncbi:injection protein [Escherichia coli]|nr:injection protein [Escherichia coli]HAX7728279.1 injection protein [Escherichia coli]
MLITHIAHKHLNRAVYEKGGDGGASKAQAKAQQQAIDLQREQWNTVMNNLKPYAEVGLPALQQLQGLMTLEGQNKAANDFFGSGLYKTQADQARYQNLVSAEATGGLGSTATSNQLSSIAPMLYNNWLSGQMQNYGNLLNVGMNAASGQATAGQNYANNTGQLLQGLGAIRAGQAQQPSSLARGIGGAASGALAGAQLGSVVPGIGKGLENTASAVSRAVRGDMSPEAKAAVNFASERNLPLMTSDMLKDKTFMQSQAQTLGERVPFFGTGKNRLNQQQARENLVRTFSDGLGGISDKQLYESATKGQQKFIEAAGKRYNRIIDAMGDTPVDLSNTVKAIDNQIAVLSRPGKSQDRAAVKVLQQFKDDITSGPNDLRLARENRTDLRKRFMASSDTVDKDTLQKASDIIYKAYTADMKKAVAKNLGADEAINMARVDRSWSKFNDMMGRTRVQKAIASGKATPEDVTKLVFSQSPSERSQLYRLLDDNGRQNARAAIVQNAVDKATDPSGNISVEKFINALHRNRKQSATFFKGVHGKELDGVIKYLNDTRHAAKANVQNLNGQQLYGLLVGGGIINAAVLAGMLKTAAFVVPAAGAVGGAAKAYESPVIRNALLRLANTPKGSTAYDRAISTVTQSLTTAAQASQKEAQ